MEDWDGNMVTNDEVKKFIAVVRKPLAELRQKQVAEISGIKDLINGDGVAIGISPSDKTLNEYTRGEITHIIRVTFNRLRARGSDGVLVPVAPLALHLTGEYSPQHRWHYHGIIKVNNIVTLDRIKKRLNKLIGRTVTEQINNTENYINYMFKQYISDENNYYMWDKDECYIHVDRK